MCKLTYALIIVAACSLSGCQMISPFTPGSRAAGQPLPSATQAAAAQQGLATLTQLVNAKNYAALGFNSPDEVHRATLGQPLSISTVRLDALLAYTDQTSPETLLVDARRSLYPVEVSQRVATSVFVTGSTDGWRATDLGNPAVARGVTRYRSRPTDFIVHVPALQVYFVGNQTEGMLMLTPVRNDARADFRAGEPIPAHEAFKRLQPLAQGYNGLPQ